MTSALPFPTQQEHFRCRGFCHLTCSDFVDLALIFVRLTGSCWLRPLGDVVHFGNLNGVFYFKKMDD